LSAPKSTASGAVYVQHKSFFGEIFERNAVIKKAAEGEDWKLYLRAGGFIAAPPIAHFFLP
jgi:hypothetical protein